MIVCIWAFVCLQKRSGETRTKVLANYMTKENRSFVYTVSFDVIIWNFSVKQRLDDLLLLRNKDASMNSHERLGSIPVFFKSQTYLDNSVDLETFL